MNNNSGVYWELWCCGGVFGKWICVVFWDLKFRVLFLWWNWSFGVECCRECECRWLGVVVFLFLVLGIVGRFCCFRIISFRRYCVVRWGGVGGLGVVFFVMLGLEF